MRLVFRSGEVQWAGPMRRTLMLTLRASSSTKCLKWLYMRDVGAKAGVQFDIRAQGFDTRFVQIEPAPVLFPQHRSALPFALPTRASQHRPLVTRQSHSW